MVEHPAVNGRVVGSSPTPGDRSLDFDENRIADEPKTSAMPSGRPSKASANLASPDPIAPA